MARFVVFETTPSSPAETETRQIAVNPEWVAVVQDWEPVGGRPVCRVLVAATSGHNSGVRWHMVYGRLTEVLKRLGD